MSRSIWLGGVGLLVGFAAASAGEIGFIEQFSLAPDRTVPLKQLIPGTEDYYYYHCLHFQHTEQWEKVDETLKAWIDRYKYTPRVYEILNRQMLLTYQRNPEKSLAWLRERLSLRFDHQRELLDRKPNLPTALDPGLISPETLRKRAFALRPNTLQGLEDAALEGLAGVEITPDQRRELISRLTRPDYPNLPHLIADDLNYRNSGGFGQFPIHTRLLLAQLDELLKLKPDLLNQGNFVNAYLSKLLPSDDVNWRQDKAALAAYLDRLWAFVQKLAPVHNSLKAHVLYQQLVLNRSRGVYDQDRFLEYIKLPRQVFYIEPKFMESEESRRYPANLQADYSGVTGLPIIGNDEPLVRSYLQHFFLTAENYKAYEPYIRDEYLKHLFAETKIVNGLGDPEQWYSLLPPELYQALKERIDLDFDFTNKTEFAGDEPVALDLYVKNVQTLIVKVFQINTQNYYRAHLREINTDINLDGLVANTEHTYQYDDPPLRRVKRHFGFPTIDKRGVYVIDFIGNGMSSRALIRKGKLRYLVRTTTAGQVFTILDERNQRVNDATLWLAGTLYRPDKDGTILTPFSNQPGRQPIVISQGGFSSLEFFQQEAEEYQLAAGMYVDREELLTRRKARLIIRPSLTLNGTPVSVSLLEDVRLTITSHDLEGVATSKEIPEFKLFEDREAVFEFLVPQRLASLSCLLRAKVQHLSQNKKIDLQTQQNFAVNEIDRTEKIEDLHLVRAGGQYAIDVLGKSGEAQPDRPVQIALKHRDYRDPVHVALQSDSAGRVRLGALPGILTVTATGPEGTSHTWTLPVDEHSYSEHVHAAAGQTILVPYMGSAAQPLRTELSLLELRGENFVVDRFDHIALQNGLLEITNLPPGDYSLLLKQPGTQLRIRVTEGERRDGYVLGSYRRLEELNPQPLQLAAVAVTDEALRIQLRNATPFARVHVFATRFQPAYSAYSTLGSIRAPEPYLMTAPLVNSLYVTGRNIGDEYRYILDRKFKRKYPGNMLERPSLLLNPWAVRSTQTGEQLAEEGTMFERGEGPTGGAGGRPSGRVAPPTGLADFANLDFLTETSLVLANLTADADGVLEIRRADLGAHHDLTIVAVDPLNTASRRVSLPEPPVKYGDLRLARILDVDKHYTQQKRITPVAPQGQLIVPDITSAKFEVYDSLARVFGLYATLNPDPNLIEFGFILNWPQLKPEEKRALYSEYACHELSFFLSRKDPEFFQSAVKPYLANKKDKTFLDRYLLEEDLRAYLEPWNFAQLNTLERILLARRIEAERSATERFVREQWELLSPDPAWFEHLFRTALKGSALETADALGFIEKQAEAKAKLSDLANLAGLGGEAAGVPANGALPQPGAPPAEHLKKAEEREMLQAEADRRLGRLRRELAGKDAAKADAEQLDSKFFDESRRDRSVAQYYRKLDQTQEWAENNYYHLLIEQQDDSLVTVNSFWRDFAAHDPAQPFYSPNFAEASRNFAEMMLALGVLDLPFAAGEHETSFDGPQMTFTAASPVVAFHEEIRPAETVAEQTPILVSQNFFRHSDRYRYVDNVQQDKFVTDEFLVDVVYGCQVVVTNPTSSPQKLSVLVQIPQGSLPVLGAQATRSVQIDLPPYHTQSVEYHFYFPAAGEYPHYPVHVAANEQVLAFAAPFTFRVVNEPTSIDKQSWDYVSQHASGEEVLAFLRQNNVLRLNLDRIAFRMADPEFFRSVIQLLTARHVYNHTLWSYSVKHNDVAAMRQYLQHANEFIAQCGEALDSPLVTIDPVARKTYQHLDYKPLVNARVGQLGRVRQILNDRFLEQYNRLLKVLSYRRQLTDDDLMAVTYYMLLQDRIEEAQGFFQRVNPDRLASRLQYDYFTAYLDFYHDRPEHAHDLASRYADHPVDRWKNAFANVLSQADEIVSQTVKVVDTEERTQVQTGLAAATPAFDFHVEAKEVRINYQNLSEVRVNYYLMDVELLFSRNPFVQGQSQQFSYILPNATEVVQLPEGQTAFAFPLPPALHSANVLVEIDAGGQTRSQPYYANALTVQTIENYGQVRVTEAGSNKPLAKVYVKAYARMQDGTVRFYKDGYTDLRGRFDYTSLNTNELDFVDRFALLILSEERGAVVREAAPPKR